MKHLDPKAVCPCGSGKQGEFCCIRIDPPVAVPPVGYNNIKLQISGLNPYGQTIGVPPELTSTISLKNPNQISPEVIEMMERLMEMVTRVRENAAASSEVGDFIQNLEDALEAVRYHQRQFLARYRIVQSHYADADVTGSDRIRIVFNDRPLQYEFEAVVIRARAALDAAGHLALWFCGQKPDKFGAFCSFLKKNGRKIRNAQQISELIALNEPWLIPDRDYRDMIVHKGQLRQFRSLQVSVTGIDVARLENDDTVEYCLRVWPRIIEFTEKLIVLMSEQRRRVSHPIPRQD